MSKAQPTRRTLVKGAAWSVPVVATSAQAAHAAASTLCTLTVTVTCETSQAQPQPRLVFGYTITGPVMPTGPLTFRLSNFTQAVAVGVDASYRTTDGLITLSQPKASGTLIRVTRNGADLKAFSVSVEGDFCATQSGAAGRLSMSQCFSTPA